MRELILNDSCATMYPECWGDECMAKTPPRFFSTSMCGFLMCVIGDSSSKERASYRRLKDPQPLMIDDNELRKLLAQE